MIRKTEIPSFYCSDEDVQLYCQAEAWNFDPYDPAARKTARGLIEAAVERFGHWRCYDIEFWHH